MALRAVPDHPKFARLKKLLKLPKYAVLGCLEGLWHFTGRYTPHGDLGKYSNEEIESWLDWDGDDGALIAALVAAGWLDVNPEHRLVVHDWHIHADDATKLAVKRSVRPFVILCRDSVPTLSPQGSDTAEETATRRRLPEPVPEPVPEPEPVIPPANDRGQKNKSSGRGSISSSKGKPSKVVDPRSAEFKSLFKEYYRDRVGKDADWDGQEGAALKKFLSANSDINAEDWRTILNNRTRSPGLAHAIRLSAWIKNAKCWLNGPANKFGDPITGEKNGRSNAQSKQDRTIDSVKQVLASIRAVDHGGTREDRPDDGRGDQQGAPRFDESGAA